MPLHNYENVLTGQIKEVILPIGEIVEELEVDGELWKKIPNQKAAAIRFKGSGFYENDYKGKK